MEKAFCRLSEAGTLRLFSQVSQFLLRHVNYGGLEGAAMSNEMQLMRMEIGQNLLKILVFAESSLPGQLALSALFAEFGEASTV